MLLAWLVAGLMAASPAPAQTLFGLLGDDKPPVEPAVPTRLPTLSAEAAIEFYVSPTTTNRFAIDGSTLAIDQERLVRYALIVTSRSGARNVSYEAMRCDRNERRVIALGRPDGSWSILADAYWRPITNADSVNRQHVELLMRLCSGGAAASLRTDQLLARLKNGPRLEP